MCLHHVHCLGGWVNQAFSRLSTTHGHIADCKLDSVVYAGVCVVILHCLGSVQVPAYHAYVGSSASANSSKKTQAHSFEKNTGILI